ncbi:MAG: methylated-DNA--[protein]-cysteine S-methyltransferase [SAR202 cluster bacterium]|jgi:methylated-DNA-[protein]-cysteine S-methyltransferase|nr:methylated-DNA--[protein]-cysteine S-methyltransferase [SAR202 cluster bacterium]
MALVYDIIETPLGWMGMLASDRGLTRTTLPRPTLLESLTMLGAKNSNADHHPKRFDRLKGSLSQYFSGGQVSFDQEEIHLDNPTCFRRKALAACREIPYGETRTYSWLAARVGKKNAHRAAGQCMAHNPLPIIIPCHRVIASDGSLRGFGRGTSMLNIKRWLLGLESGM